MKNNIILAGMMGAGKTFIGKSLKKELPKMNLIDVDEYIEQTQNMKISEIFKKYGESYFRNIEAESIKKIIESDNQIISLGGGVFEREENRNILNKNGYTIYLKAPAEVLFERIKNETHRPLLQQGFGLERIKQILNTREINYSKAMIIVETQNKSEKEIIQEIFKRIKDYGK